MSGRSIDDYLRRYERVCAAVIAYSQWQTTPRCAADLLKDVHDGRPNYSPWVEVCYDSDPRMAVQRAIRFRHSLCGYAADYQHTLAIVRTATRPVPKWPLPPVSAASRSAPSLPNLIITTEGFINLDQAVEYRLRYVDLTRTDAIWGIDVLLSNGTSHLIAHKDQDSTSSSTCWQTRGT